MEKGGLHEDHIRFPRDRVGNDGDGIAIAVILIGGAGIFVLINIISCTRIAIKLALRINGHRSTSNARAPQILTRITIQII